MNDKQRRFADEYLIDGNASRAYVAAGYSSKTPDKNAYKLLDRPEIKEYIKQEQEKMSEKLEITRETILLDLENIKNDNIENNPSVSIKALDLQIKMLGYNAPTEQKINITQEQPLFGPLDDKKGDE